MTFESCACNGLFKQIWKKRKSHTFLKKKKTNIQGLKCIHSFIIHCVCCQDVLDTKPFENQAQRRKGKRIYSATAFFIRHFLFPFTPLLSKLTPSNSFLINCPSLYIVKGILSSAVFWEISQEVNVASNWQGEIANGRLLEKEHSEHSDHVTRKLFIVFFSGTRRYETRELKVTRSEYCLLYRSDQIDNDQLLLKNYLITTLFKRRMIIGDSEVNSHYDGIALE